MKGLYRQTKSPTRKQILSYVDQLCLQIENDKKAIYDTLEIFTDYIEMKGETKKFAEYRSAKFGSLTQIPTRWSVFWKFIKDKYLQLKKKLDY